VRWCEGWGLFSSWELETEEDWRCNFESLRRYAPVCHDGADERALWRLAQLRRGPGAAGGNGADDDQEIPF
jgi:hypothetical protein